MSDWIEWNGGECPIDGGTIVNVRLRYDDVVNDRSCDRLPVAAWKLWWDARRHLGNIVAYRIADDD